MSGGEASPRETFKAAAEAAVRLHKRNIGDRGISGPDSALHVGSNRDHPGLLDDLADAAEAAYGDAAPAGKRQRAV
jgi:hypothetical protein